VNPSIKTDYGWTPIHWAAHNGHTECVRMLVEAGANINSMSDTSKTPLDMVKKGNKNLISSILLAAGAKTGSEVYASYSNRPGAATEEDDGMDSDSDTSSEQETIDTYVARELDRQMAIMRRAEARTDLTLTIVQKVAEYFLKELQDSKDLFEIHDFTEEIRTKAQSWKRELQEKL
jgi:ankyrin repeat protein